MGPPTYGLITLLTGGNHRAAILSTLLLFGAGLWLLKPVDMARGQRSARDVAQFLPGSTSAGRSRRTGWG